jgi:hypothetical protein
MLLEDSQIINALSIHYTKEDSYLDSAIENFKRLNSTINEYLQSNQQKKIHFKKEKESNIFKIRLKKILNFLKDNCDEYKKSKNNRNEYDYFLSPAEKLIHPELFFSSIELSKLNILNLIFRGKYKFNDFYRLEKVKG